MRYTVLVIMLLRVLPCLGQQAEALLFHHLDSRSGLGDPKLWDVFRDSYGLLWIASENGLTRFDGTSCHVYRNMPGDTNSICANYIVNIIEDKERNLWIGTQNGFARYNRRADNFTNFKKLKADRPLAPNFYSFPFFIDDKNYLWAYLGGEVFKVDITTRSAQFVSTYSNGHIFVNQPFYTPLKRYVSRGTNGIFITDIKEGKEVISRRFFMLENDSLTSPVTYVHQVLMEYDSLYWLCTDAGLIALNPISNEYRIYKPEGGTPITCIAPDPVQNGRYFTGTSGGGLLRFDKKQEKFTARYKHDPFDPQSLAANNIIGLLTDPTDNIFVLMPGRGMDYTNVRQAKFSRLLTKSEAIGLQMDNSISALAYSGDFLFLGTEHSGIIVRDLQQEIYIRHFLPQSGITLIVTLKDGRVLVYTTEGLFYLSSLKGSRWRCDRLITKGLEDVSGKLQVNDIRYACGSLLAATASGMASLDINGNNIRFGFLREINDDVEWPNFQRIIPVSDSSVLLQTYYTNLYRFSYTNGVFTGAKEIARTPFQTNASINARKNIWLATSSGLWYISKENWTLKPYALGNYYCTGMLSDRQGKLWCATTNGLLSFSIPDKRARIFRPEDGLQHFTYNTNSLLALPNGRFVAGGNNGLNVFDPSQIQEEHRSFSIQITGIEVNDKPYKELNPMTVEKMDLDYDQNTLAFRITPIYYGNTAQLTVRYLLKGYESELITIRGEGIVRYPQLPPGSYTLIAFGEGASKRELYITIHPPFWASWWFRSLLFLVIAGSIAAAVRWRIKSIKARQLQRLQLMIQSQEEERRRIARDLHDDFGARLSTLKLYMQALNKQQYAAPGQITLHAADMIDAAISELRNILFNLSPKTLEENGLAAALEDMAGHINRLNIIRCHTDTVSLSKRLSHPTEYSLYRVCQELVNNTLKHAGALHIYISIVEHEEQFVFLYEDDGKGFDPEMIKRSYGWNNIETHVQSLQGTMVVDTAPGKGLAVTIEIPKL